ncbi:hypothetical protein SAMN05421753_11466 [Planctomicrobium piriforme]|uniref:Uncharacterized protein n=1 Tax=Planctomicrobium piriforme TaxID=1576369 RepID=A0A1I3MPB9_9PLAN|nr:hypothetical protein SAMN05421753_11466 [Planctomicrobium piriforme]
MNGVPEIQVEAHEGRGIQSNAVKNATDQLPENKKVSRGCRRRRGCSFAYEIRMKFQKRQRMARACVRESVRENVMNFNGDREEIPFGLSPPIDLRHSSERMQTDSKSLRMMLFSSSGRVRSDEKRPRFQGVQ